MFRASSLSPFTFPIAHQASPQNRDPRPLRRPASDLTGSHFLWDSLGCGGANLRLAVRRWRKRQNARWLVGNSSLPHLNRTARHRPLRLPARNESGYRPSPSLEGDVLRVATSNCVTGLRRSSRPHKTRNAASLRPSSTMHSTTVSSRSTRTWWSELEFHPARSPTQ